MVRRSRTKDPRYFGARVFQRVLAFSHIATAARSKIVQILPGTKRNDERSGSGVEKKRNTRLRRVSRRDVRKPHDSS